MKTNMKQLAMIATLALSALLAACGGGGSSSTGGGAPTGGGSLGATTITLASSVNPVNVGQTTTLTATVTGAAPTGSVTFKDGSVILGTASVTTAGVATFSAIINTSGSHSLTAVYGGDATNASSTSVAVSEVGNTPGNLLTTAQPSPFAAGTIEAQTWDEITRIRIGGGFGAPIYDDVMAKAAAAHEQYNLAAFAAGVTGIGHSETPGQPGFTGVDPQARCAAAAVGTAAQGAMACGEVLGSDYVGGVNVGLPGLYTLATGHLQNILSYISNHMGMNIVSSTDAQGLPADSVVIDLGTRSDSQAVLGSAQVNNIVGIYPFNGMTGVGTGLLGVSYATGAAVYSAVPLSILVQSSNGVNPVVTTFTLRKQGDTVDTPAVIHDAGTMAGTEPTIAGWSILFPTVVLDQNTQYTVTYAATIGGVAVNKTWTFTTGTSPYTRTGG